MKERYITQVMSALKNNKLCDAGLLATQQVFFYESGPSGDKELLAFIFSDDEYSGYWYGHI
ncbi:MAG: hypothetical protein LBB60_00570, partial [Desulfovibrio sp.]|nr:hypothetical protein [Desulfovibrio sp.]